jgi:uncharacterized protein (DUF2062 family)
MTVVQKKYNFFEKVGRAFKLNFIKLLRSPGGAKKVSLGFAIGFGLEMLVISTASLIYIFFIPIVRLAKGSLPASIIGNVIGKLTFLPVILLPFAKKLGKIFFPLKVNVENNSTFSFQDLMHGDIRSVLSLLHGGLHLLIGMTIFGLVFGIIAYFVVHYFYEKERMKRLKKRRMNDSVHKNTVSKNLL